MGFQNSHHLYLLHNKRNKSTKNKLLTARIPVKSALSHFFYAQWVTDVLQCNKRAKKFLIIIKNILKFVKKIKYPFERLNSNNIKTTYHEKKFTLSVIDDAFDRGCVQF